MSIETQRRCIVSEWRTVIVSQTSYPIMYKIEQPQRSEEAPRWFAPNYATIQIPLGSRILTKWQEQVRPMDSGNDRWYVVREWNEADMSCDNNKATNNNNTEIISDCVTDRTHIYRILTEVGLNPSDYIFSPVPEDRATQEPTSNHTSAFSSYPSQQGQNDQQILKSQTQSLFTSGRPLSYVQHPPPPPPQPASSDKTQAPPPTSQASNNQQQNPPPSHSQQRQQGSSAITQYTTSQAPQAMSQRVFSPRRTPPPPPSHFHSGHSSPNLSAEHYLRQINSHEVPPVKVVKPSTQNVVYRKEIRIRYLQPPTPPPPAPIIIREKHIAPHPIQSPLLIRERKPEARTPPPLTIRERPPTPPAPLEPYVIEKNIPPAPPQPRQIIIERLPTPPPKPRTVIFEKWLPYKKVKRPVLLQKVQPLEPVKPTRNVIIEYEPLKAFTVRRVIEEGVFRVDPHQFSSYNAQSHSGAGDVRVVERIEDLPPPSEQLQRVLSEYKHSEHHSSPNIHSYDHHSHHNLSDHVPSSIQNLLAGARPTSHIDQLTNVSRASSTPAHRQERVLSGYNSSITSPVVIPLQRSRSSHSNNSFQNHRQHLTPTRSPLDDIY